MRDLFHRKTHVEIASKAGFPNPNVYVTEAPLLLFARAF
jgi:hypothetical protein